MHNITQKHTCTSTYAAALAHTIVAYAEKHTGFAQWLTSVLALEITPEGKACTNVHHSPALEGLQIRDEVTGMRRTYWLLEACRNKELAGYRCAVATLSAWSNAREREMPKAFVLGLTAGILPIGLWGEPKRKFEPMDILVRDSFTQLKAATQLRTVTYLTHTVVEKALVQAGGRTSKLEPELGDWLFGGKDIALFTAPPRTLEAIAHYIETLDAPHATGRDKQGITALAITPSVYTLDLPESDSLLTLEQ